jgi:hypothetical protein
MVCLCRFSSSGETLNAHHLSPYMKPLGADYSNGVNFAIAGATAMPGDTPFSLDVQVDQFVFYKDRCNESIARGLLALRLTEVSDFFHAL